MGRLISSRSSRSSRPSRRALVVGLAPLISLLTGCADSGNSQGWTTTVDTLPSGAIHVVNLPPAAGIRPTWTIKEELRIGSSNPAGPAGPTTFGLIKGIAVLPDGRIAVLAAQAREIRLFGPDGGYLTSYGGQGAGPGEMDQGFGLMLGPEGRLWVPDQSNARMSVYDPDKGFERSYPMHLLLWGFVWGGVMGAEGRILKPSITLAKPRSNVLRVFDREMNLLDSLPLPEFPKIDPENPPNSFHWKAPDGRSGGYYQVPYFPQLQQLVDPRGVIWSTAFGDASYRIARWAPGGDTTLVLETRRPPVPVTGAERDSVIEAVREQLRKYGGVNQDWSKIPETKPAVSSMFVADDGRLWVQVPTPDGHLEYDVYERDGRWAGTAVGSLKVWAGVKPIVRGDRFWAVVTDELDVPYIVRARITPAGEAPRP